MTEFKSEGESAVLVQRNARMMSMTLNRPRALNSLNLEMIRFIDKVLDEAEANKGCKFILVSGGGDRGFCAGGDIKALAQAVRENSTPSAEEILKEEYDLCLRFHRFLKPIIVLADGITMGAGLGLAAGADLVVATEKTRMAMPETRIGFFPDVGSTGWMFNKCPEGYPEYLGLTGYEMVGDEAVRVGFASHLVKSEKLPELVTSLEGYVTDLWQSRSEGAKTLLTKLAHFFDKNVPNNPAMDQWVAEYFAGKDSMAEIMESLRQCSIQTELCDGVFTRLAERSPTAVVLTLKLLRHNEMRPLNEVFRADLKAARFILAHPDYVEGVRTRLIEKDDNPRWQPASIEEVGELDVDL